MVGLIWVGQGLFPKSFWLFSSSRLFNQVDFS